jgi:hypothetical protein
MLKYERVKELFDYKDDGRLIRKSSINKNLKKLSKHRYRSITIDGKTYLYHRVVWLWHKGYWPENGIDHINRIRTDNRIENLRETSGQCNIRNSKLSKINTTGIKGICINPYTKGKRGRWKVYIGLNKKMYIIGFYRDFNEAVLARLAIEQCLEWEGCDSTSPAYMYALKNKLIKQ